MESKLQALKVPDLKKLLQDANLPVSGTKAELIKRLLEHPTATTSLGGGAEEEDLLGEYDADPPATTTGSTAALNVTPAAKVIAPPTSSIESADPTSTISTSATSKVSDLSIKSTTSDIPVAITTAASTPSQSVGDRKAALIEELEKRKMRALKFGMPTTDAEAKLQRAIKFGSETTDPSLKVLEEGLRIEKKSKEAKKEGAANSSPKPNESKANLAAASATAPTKLAETEEVKAARLAIQEADEEAKRKRAERFGIPVEQSGFKVSTKTAKETDPIEEEKKRKRMEKFGGTSSAESAGKKVKA